WPMDVQSTGQSRSAAGKGRPALAERRLHLAVEVELVGVRSEGDLLRALALESQVRVDHVAREDVAAKEVFMVGLQGVEGLLERAGGAGDAGLFLVGQFVDVLVA